MTGTSEADDVEALAEVLTEALRATETAGGWWGRPECEEFGRLIAPRVAAHVRARVAVVDARLAAVEALADDLCAWDLVDMVVPDSVDVPDDYELAMNDAGTLLHAVLRSDPSEATGPKYAAGHGFTPGKFSGGCRVMLARYSCNYTPEQHDPGLPPEDLDHFGYRRDRFTPEQGEEPTS